MLRRISTLADAGVPLRRALDEAVASEDHRSDPTGQ